MIKGIEEIPDRKEAARNDALFWILLNRNYTVKKVNKLSQKADKKMGKLHQGEDN
jgi:hypothetical protein